MEEGGGTGVGQGNGGGDGFHLKYISAGLKKYVPLHKTLRFAHKFEISLLEFSK